MTIQSSFRDRDHEGLLVSGGNFNFTDNVVENPDWLCIQIGGSSNTFPKKRLEVTGELTSPGSFGSNPDDRIVFLDVRHTPRGDDYNAPTAITESHQILKFKDGEVSTEKEIATPIVIDLNTYGRTDGNIYIRIRANDGITYTAVDMTVTAFGNSTAVFTKEAPTSETNNLRSTAVNGACNTVEEIPSSTAGYVEFKFTQFGHFGDIKTDNKVGMSPSSAIGSDPKYYWKYTAGDGTGNNPLADAVHDGTTVANDVVVAEGDTLRVSRDASGNYTYLKNGASQGTGGSTDTTAQKGDFKLTFSGGRALGVRMDIGAGAISPTFENLSDITTY